MNTRAKKEVAAARGAAATSLKYESECDANLLFSTNSRKNYGYFFYKEGPQL